MLPHPPGTRVRSRARLGPAAPRRRSPGGPARCGAARGGQGRRPGRGCRARRRDSRRASGRGRGGAGPARRPRTETARRGPGSRCRPPPPGPAPQRQPSGSRRGRARRSPPGRPASAAPPASPRRPPAPHAHQHRQMAALPPRGTDTERFRLRATRRSRHVTPRADQWQRPARRRRPTRPRPRPRLPRAPARWVGANVRETPSP